MQPAARSIGLLGGSFNPAHDGHLHISLEAMKRLGLDEVWWLVSPQNPLKQKSDLAAYDARLHHARELTASHAYIHISDFEAQHGLHYSIDTIAALKAHYPRTQFIWLMGADNLGIFHRWRSWEAFFHAIPIAVFDRAPFSHAALRSKAAIRFRSHRHSHRNAAPLKLAATPAWSYYFMPRHPLSATALRKSLGKNAFIRHTD